MGNTSARLIAQCSKTVHPHASGEHAGRWFVCHASAGSSPREWGTPSKSHVSRRARRFIPTRVGNTRPSRFGMTFAPVHPHASGEHHVWPHGGRRYLGSSPREWGTLFTPAVMPLQYRFIPTRVGNTPLSTSSDAKRPVHPHASGQHCTPTGPRTIIDGSSPREWGTLADRLAKNRRVRFIPTRVGNTAGVSTVARGITVHPHASGEHDVTATLAAGHGGSSPREWGTLCGTGAQGVRSRFIPTRVGNTRRADLWFKRHPVHPHASGEHGVRHLHGGGAAGSSPREWGTRACYWLKCYNFRFIPTRVGNTLAF